jgi:hypothetical protein
MISGTLNVEECFSLSHGRVSGCSGVSVPEKVMPIEEGNGLSPVLTGLEVSDCKFSDAVCIDRNGTKNIEYK